MGRSGRRVLGIDPGSRSTGYGVVEHSSARLVYVASGCIRPTAGTFVDRLGEIYHSMQELLDAFQPDELAIEEVFVARNPATSLKLGQARGVAIAAGVSRELPV